MDPSAKRPESDEMIQVNLNIISKQAKVWNSDHKDKHDLILLLIGLLKDAISSYSGDVNDFREVIGRLKGLLESVQTMVDTFLTYCSKAELKRYKRDDDDEDQSGPSTSKKIC
uniref:Uncharacterized protein n=1 Tax=Meloidogyne hapla TaxID=6305 RepID=A0A1I8B359_MELHA